MTTEGDPMTGRQVTANLDTEIEAAHNQYRADLEEATKQATIRLQKRLAAAYAAASEQLAGVPVYTPPAIGTHQAEIVEAVKRAQTRPPIPDPPPAPRIDPPQGFTNPVDGLGEL